MSDYSMLIDGKAVAADKTFEVKNPATGEIVGRCPIASRDHLDQAVAAAQRAFAAWSRTSDEERAETCRKMAGAVAAHAEELARLLTQEQGKPLKGVGSEAEVSGCSTWAMHTADLTLPVKVIQDDEQARVEQHRKPLGVVGSITPWNWPLMIATWHVTPAIRTGNTAVIKPSPYTPLSTIRLVEIFNEVLPPGVLNLVTGQDSLGQWMTEHPGIQKIIFTGSSPTGKKVMSSAASNLKRLTLELGGNDAGIVLKDAEPKAIAEKIIHSAFINNGQTCAALKRLYVHEDIYDAMCEVLVKAASGVAMGNGLDENNRQGPIQNDMQYKKVLALLEDAKKSGATVLCGGEAPEGPGYFLPYTLVSDISDGTRLVDEEQFGPVLPIIRYSDEEDVIRRANNSENGLGGSVWSADIEHAADLASRLECGTAWVNAHGNIMPHVPFGGVKSSGFGVEFAEEGLEEYTSIQIVNVNKGGG